MSRAVIIGNGPSALEKNAGEFIDSDYFDTVFRLNRWAFDIDSTPFKQYPLQVGNRCDVWVVNDLHLTQTKLALKHGHIYQKVLVVAPRFKWNGIAQHVNELKINYPFLDIIPFQYEDAINQIVNFEPKWPSTGIVTISFVVNHFDEVYLQGFDSYDTKYSNLHYFESADSKHGKNKFKGGDTNDHTPSKDRKYIDYVIQNFNVKLI